MNCPPSRSTVSPEAWDLRYRSEGFWFGDKPNGWLAKHASHWSSGAHVLCVADGEGRNSVWLAQQGLRVDAFDPSSVGMAKAAELAASRGVCVNFTVADCDTYCWPHGSVDGVAAIFIQFADPRMRERLFQRMVDSLRLGGVMVLQGYTVAQLAYGTGGPPCASHLYTRDLLLGLLPDMEILALEEYEADLAEGAGHLGRSALVGLVARKP